VLNIINYDTKVSQILSTVPRRNNIYELTFQKIRKEDKQKDEKPKTYSAKYGVLSKFGGLKDLLNAA